jgi:glycosyltransferase involved in cell wall biosynthesis
VLPSLAEGIPVVLMEAMASGVPCITTPVNGIPELIQHDRNGLLATPGDVDALSLQLRRAIEDAGLRQRLSVEGLKQVRQAFNLGDNVALLAAIFRSLPSAAGRTT